MISLLIAIFGKDRIPDGLRVGILLFGLTILSIRIYKVVKKSKQPTIEPVPEVASLAPLPESPSNTEAQPQTLSGFFR